MVHLVPVLTVFLLLLSASEPHNKFWFFLKALNSKCFLSGFRQREPDRSHPAGPETPPPLPERVLQAGLRLLQPGPGLQDGSLRAAALHVRLQLPQTEGGPPQEPGRIRRHVAGRRGQEEEEEEEDEDGLW